ncbi:hypothetical protein E2562_037924 [Oryza meyeriana var. granulata]|uniref:Uncharacterized protein n=1 Tax=Oryza meyeriana var. granulata TaxID=110450 RepID=A0A6G1E890_9ORYZ|nr:hypothetical protein E2562_037924 [Oryza meyeriana var. granulata]
MATKEVAAAAPAAGSTVVPCVAPIVVASGAGSSSGCAVLAIVALGFGSSGSDAKARHRPPHPPIKRTTTKPKSRLAIARAPSALTTPSAPATLEASSSGGGLRLLKSMGSMKWKRMITQNLQLLHLPIRVMIMKKPQAFGVVFKRSKMGLSLA